MSTFTDWARKPAATLQQYNRSSPNLLALRDDLRVRFPGVRSLGIYGVRDARGTTVPSVHSWGAALDLSFRGLPRDVADAIIDFLIRHHVVLGVQAVHDYQRSRIWRSWRPASQGGAGWKTQRASSSGMGQAWADWLHIETTEQAWADSTPIAQRVDDGVPVAVRPRVTMGSRGPAVRVAQQIMAERAGQDVGPFDGVFGARTLAAWQNVAAWCRWPVDVDIAGDDWSLLAWIDQGWSRLNAAGVPA